MRKRTVWRYYCDFCKKAGLSKHFMQRHEDHCTLNPLRKCRMCVFANGGNGAALPELLALLPNPVEARISEMNGWEPAYWAFVDKANAALPILREAADNCPACIMAALRQKGIPVPMIESFDFKKECADIFSEVNSERMESCNGY